MSLIVQSTVTTPVGSLELSLTIPVNASGLFDSTEYSLTTGTTTIAVPGWALTAIIVPNTANAHTLLFKLNSGDTFRNLSPISPTIMALDASNLPADIYLESSGTDVNPTTVIFI